jgi:hypothetical protein
MLVHLLTTVTLASLVHYCSLPYTNKRLEQVMLPFMFLPKIFIYFLFIYIYVVTILYYQVKYTAKCKPFFLL